MKRTPLIRIAALLAFSPLALARANAGQDAVPNPTLREWAASAAVFAAPDKHHFNLDAPNKAFLLEGGSKSSLKLTMTDHEAHVAIGRAKPGERIRAELFLCDDAKTFCVRKSVEAEVPALAPKKKALKSE